MTTVSTPVDGTAAPIAGGSARHGLAQLRPASTAYPRAFLALLQRDFHVLSQNAVLFIIRTIMQPLLLMFVFTYVFPKIGQGVGAGGGSGGAEFTSSLVAGVVTAVVVIRGGPCR